MGDNLRDKQFTNWLVISIVWSFLLRMIHSDTLSITNYLKVKHLAFQGLLCKILKKQHFLTFRRLSAN